MFYPDFKELKKLSRQGNLIPVYREILADMETPVSAFSKLGDTKNAYLLESVEGGEKQGRYSFLSTDINRVFKPGKDAKQSFLEIEKFMGHFKPVRVKGMPRFSGGLVGYVSYDMISCFENLKTQNNDELKLPLYMLMLAGTTLIFDHVTRTIKVVSCVEAGNNGRELKRNYETACGKINGIIRKLNRQKKASAGKRKFAKSKPGSNFGKKEFEKAVTLAKAYIRSGDIIQAVLSQRLRLKVGAAPFDVYRALRLVNPSPYMYYLKLGSVVLAGSSPETLVRNEEGIVTVRPIAGTRRRGSDEAEDRRLEKGLLSDSKERAEHIMLVDLGRNDIGRVCEYGTVRVDKLMAVERYSHVMHIVSEVTGKLRKNKNSFDVLRACFPAGTVSGAPKIRAMEIIEELENVKRGPYAGAVGYFGYQGNMDMAINIRAILFKKGTAYVQAGAGIVADSVPEREYNETLNKGKAMMKAIEMAEEGL